MITGLLEERKTIDTAGGPTANRIAYLYGPTTGPAVIVRPRKALAQSQHWDWEVRQGCAAIADHFPAQRQPEWRGRMSIRGVLQSNRTYTNGRLQELPKDLGHYEQSAGAQRTGQGTWVLWS